MSGATGGKRVVKLSNEELAVLVKHYDRNRDGTLNDDEIADIVNACRKDPKGVHPEVVTILQKYDENKDGKLDASEVKSLITDIYTVSAEYRYAGYTGAFARAFRYLAFTSDVGEAMRPVMKQAIVTATYGVAAAYCVADVAWETYKVKKTGKNEKGHPCTPMQMCVERTTFQLVASLVGPALLIHTAVDGAKWATRKMNRFQRWGPSIFGLAIIPLLPMYLDEPAEHGIEWLFAHYGPWATPGGRDKKEH